MEREDRYRREKAEREEKTRISVNQKGAVTYIPEGSAASSPSESEHPKPEPA